MHSEGKAKVNLSLCLNGHHATKAYWRSGDKKFIQNFSRKTWREENTWEI